MDLRLSEEQTALRETLRRLFERRLTELAAQLPQPPQHSRAQAVNDATDVGLLALGLPEDSGGLGTFVDLALAHEEMGRGLAAPVLVAATLAARLVLHAANPVNRTSLLAAMAAGGLVLTPGVDGAEVDLTEAPDGAARLSGRVPHVVDGPDSDGVLVHAQTAQRHDALVLVPRAAEGARWLEEQPACDVACATLVLDDVTVTADRVLGRDAVAPLRTYRDEAAVLAAARAVGGGFAVLDRTVDYVKTRVQFERPIGTFQAVQHQLADVATSLDAAWLAVAQAASTIEQDAAPADVTRTAMTAVVAATDAFRAATLVAHQLHGGMGFVLDSPLHLWSARAVADPTLLRPRRHLLDALAPV